MDNEREEMEFHVTSLVAKLIIWSSLENLKLPKH